MMPGLDTDFWHPVPIDPLDLKRRGEDAYHLLLDRQRELCRESHFVYEYRLSQFMDGYFRKAEKLLKTAQREHIRQLKDNLDYRNELRRRVRTHTFREAERQFCVSVADPGFASFKREADGFDYKIVGTMLSLFCELEQEQDDPLAFLDI